MKGRLGTKERLLTMLALLLVNWVSPSLGQTREVKGAHATTAFSNGKATFTVYNDSGRDIKAWALTFTAHYANGRETTGAHIEEYGPPSTAKALHAGQSAEFSDTDFHPDVTSVESKVTAVVYDDNTAEATDENRIEDILRSRRNFLYTVTLISDTLKNAAEDQQPKLKAKGDLQSLLSSPDKRIAKALIKGEISNLNNVKASHERESIQRQASIFRGLAKSHEGFATVRRLP